MADILTFADIQAAAARIAPHVQRTPIMTCDWIDRRLGAQVFFKCEMFQDTGAFKQRGASNAVFALPEARLHAGVATHSSGNHGAALALAARQRGIHATIVMPENASAYKKRLVAEYDAEIIFCTASMQGRETALADYVRRSGATMIHPYNDPLIMAGQGTAALELHTEVPDLDLVLTPVGGGGLLSGTAVATRALHPHCRVIGVEPAGADDAWRSLKAGRIESLTHPVTVADGLRATIGPLTFAVIRTHVDAIVRVDEPAIVAAMRTLWERMKILVEPSSAVVLAALHTGAVEVKGQRVGVILSGGNVDLDALPW
ncbi:MAG: threonine ammonia-lyase [Gammaproteobacteria bacterium]